MSNELKWYYANEYRPPVGSRIVVLNCDFSDSHLFMVCDGYLVDEDGTVESTDDHLGHIDEWVPMWAFLPEGKLLWFERPPRKGWQPESVDGEDPPVKISKKAIPRDI